MNKKTIRDVPVGGRRVLMRVDFNVPIQNGKVGDDTRINAALPTIKYCIEHGASVVLMSHLGRPKGKGYEAEFSLQPVGARLQEILGRPVKFGPDCVGAETVEMAKALKAGEVLLVENTRFYKEEEGKAKVADDATDEQKKAAKAEMKEKQKALAEKLAKLGDGEIFVNDAFGSAHRAHASTAVVCKFYKQNVAGFLMEKEIDYLGRALGSPAKPFVAVIGGAKISSKLLVLKSLLQRVDRLIIGGAMAFTFTSARGGSVGKSLCEKELAADALQILDEAKKRNVQILLPVDCVTVTSMDDPKTMQVFPSDKIPADREGVDIGPDTQADFVDALSDAKTVFWNGPLGVFEQPAYAVGTFSFAKALANCHAVKVVGGGDSASAIFKAGMADKMDHVSTGGGASMEFIEGKVLPGVAALDEK